MEKMDVSVSLFLSQSRLYGEDGSSVGSFCLSLSFPRSRDRVEESEGSERGDGGLGEGEAHDLQEDEGQQGHVQRFTSVVAAILALLGVHVHRLGLVRAVACNSGGEFGIGLIFNQNI